VVIKHPHKNQKDARNKSPFIFYRYIYIDMTKTQLKQLIKECLNEINYDRGIKPTSDVEELIVTSTVISSDINILREYILELHNILIGEFDEDVLFEKEKQLNMIRLQNKDVKIDYKFKIINITNNEDLEIVKQTLNNIQEQLTTWALTKKSKINFIFKIE
jgi:disulfide oxidoreductase YuzD